MQMPLRHRTTQSAIMPFAQLLVGMFDRDVAVEIAIQARHPLDLRHRRASRQGSASGRLNPKPGIPMAIAFTDLKQLLRLHLVSSDCSEAAENIRETNPVLCHHECAPGP